MVTRRITTCDRCGKEIVDVYGQTLNPIVVKIVERGTMTECDLCEECHGGLLEWLNNASRAGNI